MQADPLAQLRDIRVPEPIGWWPIAPGWWILILLMLVVAMTLLYKQLKKKRENRYRGLAREELQNFKTRFTQDHNAQTFLTDTQKLLRRVALHRYPQERRNFASLSGTQWLNFLNGCCDDEVFKQEETALFDSLPYQKNIKFDVIAWQRSVGNWLERHR